MTPPSLYVSGLGVGVGVGFKTYKYTSPWAQHFPWIPLEPSRTCVNSPFMELLSNHPVGMCPLPPTGAVVSLAPFCLDAPRTDSEEPLYARGVASSWPPNTHPPVSEHEVRESLCVKRRWRRSLTLQLVALAAGHGCTASPGNMQPGQGATRGLEPKESSWPRRTRPQAKENVLSVKNQNSEGKTDQ